MLLDSIGLNNNFSEKLRDELRNEVEKMGGTSGVIRFSFDISNPNPDPDKKGGAIIWPWKYTLTPKTFRITDPHDKQTKFVGMVEETTPSVNGTGVTVTRWRSVKVENQDKGVLTLHTKTSIEDFEMAMYLLLHPANAKGKFRDATKRAVFELIDDKAVAQERTKLRGNKVKALLAVEKMSVTQLRDFALAMAWDETDVDIIRDNAQAIAESDADMLLNLLDETNKTVEYKATIKKAEDKGLIFFDAMEYSYKYVDTRQVIFAVEPSGQGEPQDKLAFWFINGGEKAEAAYKKLKAAIK